MKSLIIIVNLLLACIAGAGITVSPGVSLNSPTFTGTATFSAITASDITADTITATSSFYGVINPSHIDVGGESGYIAVYGGAKFYGNGAGLTNIPFSGTVAQVIYTNFVAGVVNSNSYAVTIEVDADAALTGAAANGRAELSFECPNVTTNRAGLLLTVGIGLTSSVTNPVRSIVVPPNGTYIFKNSSTAGSAAPTAGRIKVFN